MQPWTRIDYRPPQKQVTLADMRAHGVRDVLVYCGNAPACSHNAWLPADRWRDELTFGDLEPRMLSTVCGHLGADVRPGWRVTSRM